MEQSGPGTVLVTGGTGFVGSHLVELLLRRGYDVSCLVRDPSRLRWLTGLSVRTVIGDCTDPSSLDGAVRNASVIFHAAGLTKSFNAGAYDAVNHIGTRNLLEACVRRGRGIRKFVLVSSLAAAGPAVDGRPVNDRDVPRPVSDYGRSKLMAEEAVLGYRDRLPVVIVRPSAVYGPRDIDVFELFKWASKGVILDIRGGERFMQWCFVEDLAAALLLAGERDVPSGSIYCAAEDRIYGTAEFYGLLQRSGGVTARTLAVPVWMAFAIGALSEAVGRMSGTPGIMSRQKVREAVQRVWTCDQAKTRGDLGFSAKVTLEEGLARTWRWYRDRRWIR